MTPRAWMLDDFVLWGVLQLFGGALLFAAVGTLLGRRRGAEFGLGVGLTMWGLGNLAVSLATAAFVYLDTEVLPLKPTRCEPSTDDRGRAWHQQYFAVQRPGEPAHELQPRGAFGVCPEHDAGPLPLRARKDALASAAPIVRAESVQDEEWLPVVAIWGLFGSFPLLGGLLTLGTRSAASRRPAGPAAPAIAPWRHTIGALLGQLGLLVLLAAVTVPFFLPGTTSRSAQFGLNAAATAMACWLLACALVRTLNIAGAAVLLFLALALGGIAQLVRLS